jgi:hypothetical protein
MSKRNTYDPQVVETIFAMADFYGKKLSPVIAQIYLDSLAKYDAQKVVSALQDWFTKMTHFPKVSEIVETIEPAGMTGWPEPDAAWAMVPKSENESGVVTSEMLAALREVMWLINEGDIVGACMAYKKIYSDLVKVAKAEKRPINWFLSGGHDHSTRTRALIDGVISKRITLDVATKIMPELQFDKRLKIENEDKKLFIASPEIPKPINHKESHSERTN